jgi:outer membrane protein OmpA-like peptidoglycan-associated protein
MPKHPAGSAAQANSPPVVAISLDLDDEDAQSIREEKDKERWARLRKVKSLFDTKSKKLQKTSSESIRQLRERTEVCSMPVREVL